MDIIDKVLKLTIDNRINWTENTSHRLLGNVDNFTVVIKMLSGYAAYYLEIFKDSESVHKQPIAIPTVDKIRLLIKKRKIEPIIQEFMDL